MTCSNNHLALTLRKPFSATNASLWHRSGCCSGIFNCHITRNQRGIGFHFVTKTGTISHNRSFDRTEFEGDLTPPNVTHLAPIPSGSRVLFRGVLSLPAFAHLSEEGLKYLDHDFQERVTRSNMNGVLAAKRYSTMCLEDIFALNVKQRDAPEAETYNISVLIQGYMHSTASFMRCMSRSLYRR